MLDPKTGSFLAEPNWETFQARPDEVREQVRSLLAALFGINNSNPLGSSEDFTIYKAVSYPLCLLILSTESMAAIIIPLLQLRKLKIIE